MGSIETQIKNIIQSELKGKRTGTNWHRKDIKLCLIEPYLEKFEDFFKEELRDASRVKKEEQKKIWQFSLFVLNGE